MSKVLIVEDEMQTAKPVQEALKIEGIEADIALNGEEGLNKFIQNKYDLILLDLKMPKLDGESVLKEIRKLDPYIDVIVYTNYEDFADIKTLTNIGIDGYINKGPGADLIQLVRVIKNKLEPLDIEDIEKLIKTTDFI